MSISVNPFKLRQSYPGYVAVILLWLSSVCPGQTSGSQSNLWLDQSYLPNGFINPQGVGLIRSSESFDFTRAGGTSTNLMITGNVGGGKHFRADIPYTAVSDFQQSLQSTYLDSFLRYTQDDDPATGSALTYTPFYSPAATVTHTRLGQPSVVTAAGHTAMPWGNAVASAEHAPTTHIRFEQVQEPDPGLDNIEPVVISDTDVSMNNIRAVQPWQNYLQDGPDRTQQGQRPDALYDEPPGATKQTTESDRIVPSSDQSTVSPMDRSEPSTSDVDGASASDNGVLSDNTVDASMLTPDIQKDIEQARALLNSLNSHDKTALEPLDSNTFALDDPSVSLSEPVTGAFPKDATLRSFHEAKYVARIKAGLDCLRRGQYQKAENAFTLATIYRTNDVEAWAGKSWALLAQEEYAGSALFLRRALTVVPDYAQVTVDLPSLIGGMEAVGRHVKALAPYKDKADPPDQSLLLAYIYLKTNDLGLAQDVLEKVAPRRSGDPVVKALQAALDKAME